MGVRLSSLLLLGHADVVVIRGHRILQPFIWTKLAQHAATPFEHNEGYGRFLDNLYKAVTFALPHVRRLGQRHLNESIESQRLALFMRFLSTMETYTGKG